VSELASGQLNTAALAGVVDEHQRTGRGRAQLVVSVSGIGRAPLDSTGWLAAELDRRSIPISLLVWPPHLAAAPDVADWVRARVAGGDAPVLRGLERLAGRPRPDRWLAGTGMAVLPAHETRLQLIAARAALAQLDLTVHAYAPPGWLVPAGTLDVLRHNGFTVCAELRGVRDLTTGELYPGRVLGPGSGPWRGEHTEPWWCRAMVLGAARAARLGRLVRLAIPAVDLARPGIATAVLDAVDLALHHGAEPATYPSLVGPMVPRPRDGRLRSLVAPRSTPRAVVR
jgi:predicted deacetylase